MSDDRDPVLAEALRRVPVPDHGPDFWSRLEARLADEPAPVADPSSLAPAAPRESGGPADDGGEDDGRLVPLLARRERRPGRSTTWLASVAAVLVVVVGAVALANRPQPDAERLRVAEGSEDEPAPTTSTTEPRDAGATTVAASPGMATPEAAVVAWLEAVGAGDVTRAAWLTGPRSKAYVEALTGGGIEGFLTEAGEGYGAWADSPDRSTTEVDLDVEGQDITIVVVSGTWTGEGGRTFRTDAIPAVRTDAGTWLVEPWAADPATGGRIVVSSPSPAIEGGFNGLAPDEVLTASAPGDGTFHFSIDDQPPAKVRGQRSGGGVRATFDPPQELASRTHLLVIAYVDGDAVSAVAGTFLVEG